MTRKLKGHLLILLAFVGLTLLMTWPVIVQLSTHIAGGRDDLWVHQWTFWWIRQALRQGLNPFDTPYLYYPSGVSLTSHNIAWFNIALWLPLQAVLGRIAAYNLVFLAVIALNGFCMYVFTFSVTRSRTGAFVAGLIFGFWPYTLSHFDHANMMVLFWVPLALYFLHNLIVKTAEDRNFHWSWLLAAASSIAMIGISRWQLLIMSTPILIAYSVFLLFTTDNGRHKKNLLQLIGVGVLALALMAPLAAPLIVDQFTRAFPEDVFLDEPQWGRTDLLAYFIPSIHNGIWQARVAGFYENFVVNQYYTPHIGLITILLAILGLIRRWSKTWLWLMLALVYFVLALGPVLAINGREFASIPMPYRLVEDFILLRLLRRPDRLNIFLGLPIAMMGAWGSIELQRAIHSPILRKIVLTLVILLLLVTYSPIPFATTKPEIPRWLLQASADGEEYALLDIPVNDRSFDKWYMQYQTVHEKPIVTGHVSRLPAEALDFLNSIPFLTGLRERDQLPDPSQTNVAGQLHLLQEAGVRYLLIHKRFANEGLQDIWRDWLSFSPAYEDQELIVYRTKPVLGQDFTFAQQLIPDLGFIDIKSSPTEAVQGGIINVDARWGTGSAPQNAYDICLQLIASTGELVKSYCLPPDLDARTDEWPANDVRRATYFLPVGTEIEPGQYELAAVLAEPGTTNPVGETVMIGSMFIHLFAPSNVIEGNWQNEIKLVGYDLEQDQDSLTTTLFWQARKPIDTSYKVFLHLVDRETGTILAQHDAIPREWSYPTTAWKSGELVRDVIRLPLPGTSLDNYQLRVGLYDELSGQRLLVETTNSPTPQEYLTLNVLEP